MEWTNAIKNGTKPGSNFDYAGPFTEWVVMGNLSLRFPGEKLLWDARKFEVTNTDAAAKFLTKKYREGWKI